MKKKPLLVANWKMNISPAKAAKLAARFEASRSKNAFPGTIVLLPSHESLERVSTILKYKKSPIVVGAQNCFWADSGAYTGEVSLASLKELGCKYVLIGHSERRAQGESDELIALKLRALSLKKGMTPILCVGENHKERISKRQLSVLSRQILGALTNVDFSGKAMCIAYEPLWAIGSGKPASTRDFLEAISIVKEVLRSLPSAPKKVYYLYGGSVTEHNVRDYIAEGADGVLIGGASTEISFFDKILKRFKD